MNNTACPRTKNDLVNLCSQHQISLPWNDDLNSLLQPLQVGGHILPNRFVSLPMEGCDGVDDGSPGELTFRRYQRIAAGGPGIIWFEATAVSKGGRSNPHALWLNESNLVAYKELVEKTRAALPNGDKSLLILQLTHSGRYSQVPVLPQSVPPVDKAQNIPEGYPVTSDAELEQLQEQYLTTASLALRVGFDGVDIKACHGYLVNSLLSAYQRTGKYGGSYDNRTRFLRELVSKVKENLSDAVIAVRLNATDYLPYPYGWGMSEEGGLKPDLREPLRLVSELSDLGTDLFSISVGLPRYQPQFGRPSAKHVNNYDPQEHPLHGVERFISIVRVIQKHSPKTPIVNAGLAWLRGFFPHVAAGVLTNGYAQLIGYGRNSFACPNLIQTIKKEGETLPSRLCSTCSLCTYLMKNGGPAGCPIHDREIYAPVLKSYLNNS